MRTLNIITTNYEVISTELVYTFANGTEKTLREMTDKELAEELQSPSLSAWMGKQLYAEMTRREAPGFRSTYQIEQRPERILPPHIN